MGKRKQPHLLSGQYRPLKGSSRKPAPGARRIGDAESHERIKLTIVVRRNPNGPKPVPCEEMPASLELRAGPSPEEFAKNYGAAREDLDRVAAFARTRGFEVESSSIPRRTVVVSGSVEQARDAFSVDLGTWETMESKYRGREGEILVPAELADIIDGVFGLDNRPISVPSFRGGAPAGTLNPLSVAKYYNFPSPLTASGQTIGVISPMGGYDVNDVNHYLASLGIGNADLRPVPVGRGNTPPGCSIEDQEVLLDICIAATIGQGATIAIYLTTNDQAGWINALNMAIHPEPGEPRPAVIGISWGFKRSDHPTDLAAEGITQAMVRAIGSLFQDAAQMGRNGPSILVSSGDDGSRFLTYGVARVQYPASDPCVTACGGTSLGETGGAIAENSWGQSGGGISDMFARPAYQSAVNAVSVNPPHYRGRCVPDLSGNAGVGYSMSCRGGPFSANGTSAVVPLYAGLIAVLSARLGRGIGFLNPFLYALPPGVLIDINDQRQNGNPGYTCGAGWDGVTGLGRIDGQALLDALLAGGG